VTHILALDPGQSFGWALSHAVGVNTTVNTATFFTDNYVVRMGSTVCICGAWDLASIEEDRHRFSMLIDLIESQRDAVDVIVYEVAPGLRGHASIWHLGYRAIVLAASYRISVPFYAVNASTWKKAIGNARASKYAIRGYAVDHYGIDPSAPQDAIDALCILEHGFSLV
jgi:hypothetical protein